MQLLDWSRTDRRIERIFIDNPERFRESFVFTTDGCDKEKCANASMINVSARAGSAGIRRGSIKVVLRDRSAAEGRARQRPPARGARARVAARLGAVGTRPRR